MKLAMLGLCLLSWTAGAATPQSTSGAVAQVSPVKLLPLRAWRVALGYGEVARQTGPAERTPRLGIGDAWRSYLDGDALASRVAIGKWLPDLLEHGETSEISAALSVAKLNDDQTWQGFGSSLADDLTQARPNWREEPGLGSWVDLFSGAVAERRGSAAEAEESWTAAAQAQDAPLRVQGLAHLGLAQVAIDRQATSDALASLDAAERAFISAADIRGVAAIKILRISAFATSPDTMNVDSAAEAAESYCRAQGLTDGVIETLLAASDSAKALGDAEKASQLWARAEDAALRSGLLAARRLSREELMRLKQYIGVELSLAKVREYFQWAAETGDPSLIENSSRAMAAALKSSGQIGASGWYDVMAADAVASLELLPLSTQFLHAALIDYDLLEVGVDPGSRPELFVGKAYAFDSSELIGVLRRVGKIFPDAYPPELNPLELELAGLAKQVDSHREGALRALRQRDGNAAARELEEFFRGVPSVRERISLLTNRQGGLRVYDSDANLEYAAGLLKAWSMRDPGRLRTMIATLQDERAAVDAPLLLSGGRSGVENMYIWLRNPDSEALGLALARGRAPQGRSWPRLVARYAAAGGGPAVTAAAFGVSPESLTGQEGAQFQIAYAGQFALAANGEVAHVELGGEQSFDWLLRKARGSYDLQRDLAQARDLGLMFRVLQTSALTTERGAARLARTPYARAISQELPDMPEFESLEEKEDDKSNDMSEDTSDASEETPTAENDAPPKGFLRAFEFTAWSMQYPVLLSAVLNPESPDMEKVISDALADLSMDPSRIRAVVPREASMQLGEIEETKRSIVLDLALGALAGKRYRQAIEGLSRFEAMTSPAATLERVQILYVEAMCYRGLRDAHREEARLAAAGTLLEGLRRSVATRNASLRLRDLRQLIQEEYLSALYRRGNWTGMARVIAASRQASVLPAAILAAAPRHPLARELETLRDTYDTLASGAEKFPVSREDYQELFKLFQVSKRLPPGNPTLDAIEQATYLVSNELYAQTPGQRRTGAAIRPAAPGELLILESVGHRGVHTVTIDEHGRASGYYRYIPIASLEDLCRDFVKAIQEGGSSAETGARLYEKLLAYLPELDGKRCVSILADGPLLNLPWGALRAPDGQYLIQKYEIGMLSGAKPVSAGGKPSAREQILTITDPNVDTMGKLAIGVGGFTVIPLEGASATLPDIQRELPRADAVYISTHGQSDYLRPDYSFLELGGGSRLYSVDLGSLDFRGRRLLLSACETRTGMTYAGEEAYGLADAFLARNASTVVATRWEVEATAANAFSEAFYRSLRDGGDYTAAATRAARSLLTSEHTEWQAPQHWAAYEPVTRFLDAAEGPVRLTPGGENMDVAEAAGVMNALQSARKHAEGEQQRLIERQTMLNAELAELAVELLLEDDRNSLLGTQVDAGRATEKWTAAALTTARAASQGSPDQKPAERLRLTVQVKGESNSIVAEAVVSARDIALHQQISRSTDSNGVAVFPDIRTGAAYKITVAATGFANAALSHTDDPEAWFGDAEKVVEMWRLRNAVDVKVASKPKQRRATQNSATQNSAARKAPKELLHPTGPLRTLLEEINRTEASSDILAPAVGELESERTDAKEAQMRRTEDRQKHLEEIDEYRAKVDGELQELNPILARLNLAQRQRDPPEISGTVEDTNFKGLRARVTLERVGGNVEETTTADESGHFVLASPRPGVEYVVSAEADGHTAWRSLPMSAEFPGSLDIRLLATGERRDPWRKPW